MSIDIDSVKTSIMGLYDVCNYVLFKNPVSSTVIESTKYAGSAVNNYIRPNPVVVPPPPLPKELVKLSQDSCRIVFSGSPYVRFAGLSGAIAVALGAYGAHNLMNKRLQGELGNINPEYEQQFLQNRADLEDRKRVFETANRYHFIHTLALFGVPFSRRPKLVFSVMSVGMIVFCGTCYFDALTGNKSLRKYTPIGGSILILGWICFIL